MESHYELPKCLEDSWKPGVQYSFMQRKDWGKVMLNRLVYRATERIISFQDISSQFAIKDPTVLPY